MRIILFSDIIIDRYNVLMKKSIRNIYYNAIKNRLLKCDISVTFKSKYSSGILYKKKKKEKLLNLTEKSLNKIKKERERKKICRSAI